MGQFTKLDSNQVLKSAYDEVSQSLRVLASLGPGSVILDAATSSIKIGDGTDFLSVNGDGSINANVVVSAAGGDSIIVSDGVDNLAINSDGSVNVNGLAEIRDKMASNIINEKHDEILLTYVASGNGAGEIETCTYKLLGITVAQLQLVYDSNNRLISIDRV